MKKILPLVLIAFVQLVCVLNLLAQQNNDSNKSATDHPLVRIPAELHMLAPAYIQGQVVNYYNYEPLQGVTVETDDFATFTNDSGYYNLGIQGGIDQEITFSMPGFQNKVVTVNIPYFDTLVLNDTLQRIPYPPACAHAEVDTADTQCTVTWCLPMITNLYAYDDFNADTYSAWENAGNMFAVRFTPDSYPATLTGLRIMIGDGNTPFGGSSYGQQININVYDDDGVNGMPGTLLDSIITVANSFPWLEKYGLQVLITEGDFYIAMTQLTDAPDCVPLGADTLAPFAGRSYSRNVTNGESWTQQNDKNFLIHAFIESPDNNNEAFHHFKVWRLIMFNPDEPLPGTALWTLLNSNLTATNYLDAGSTWENQAAGWITYCIRTVNCDGQEAEFLFTDIVAHKLYADAGINVLSGCDTLPAQGVTVTLTGADYPHATLVAQTDTTGHVFFNNMIMGHYLMSVSGFGFTTFADSVNIQSDYSTDIILEVSSAKPENLTVNDLTGVASWDAPQFDAPGQNSSSPLQSYLVSLDGIFLTQTQNLNLDLSVFIPLQYGHAYTVAVLAHYCTGYSEPDTFTFISHYLPPPLNFTLDTISALDYALANLTWQLPDTACNHYQLLAYNLYKNDILLATISADSLHFTDTLYTSTAVCYTITAEYDLTPFGFPAETGESMVAGPECSGVAMGIPLPFDEDWSMGFDGNGWENGQNWVIQSGKSDASARFVAQPLMQNYSSPLQSHMFNATQADTSMPYDIFLYFDLTLLNKVQTNMEKLAVEILEDTTWVRVREYTNIFSFVINPEKLNISAQAKNSMFKIRFIAEGLNSTNIYYWDIDNIYVKAELAGVAPENLIVSAYGSDGNDLQLQWNAPATGSRAVNQSPENTASENFFENHSIQNVDAATPVLQGYKIYRRSYMAPGSSNDIWTLIATATDTVYIDEDLSNNGDNCYEYYVTSVFAQGESSPSNIGEACIYVNNKLLLESGIVVYPNPAAEYAVVSLKEPFEILRIINSVGIETERINIEGRKEFAINLKNYPSGTCLLQFISVSGKTEVVKIIVER